MTNVASFEQPSKVSYLKMLVCQNKNMPQSSNLLAYRILIQKTMRHYSFVSPCIFSLLKDNKKTPEIILKSSISCTNLCTKFLIN